MTRYAFTVEFDGRPFMGWQRQPDGPTVQQTIEDAIHRITGERVAVHSAGRTDAGVHGLGMRAHADIDKVMTPFRLMEGINALLRPHPVAILACTPVADDWHARFSCIGRSYVYHIVQRRPPLTWEAGLVWRVMRPLDAHAMHDAAQILVGHHDFTTFRSAHCQSASPCKSLSRLAVERSGDRIAIHAQARSFLHHQVRSMVGCLALVGMGRWNTADLRKALDARDRAALGLNAPPDGLYFVSADYPET
ncbi:MAG: tRNA pseudouridine(38-40) synthase TruA [bacterium]|nr:tRNA pseudouridine(38-40) synthase TruA [bacterium]